MVATKTFISRIHKISYFNSKTIRIVVYGRQLSTAVTGERVISHHIVSQWFVNFYFVYSSLV